MTTAAIIILSLWAVASIFLIVNQRGTIRMQRTSLQIQRIQTDTAEAQAARWRDEAMQLRRKHAKPEKRDTRPIRDGRPARTPLQDKLDSMVNAVSSKRLSPVRHAPNIQPQRHPSTDVDMTQSLIIPGVVTGMLVNDTPSYSAPDTSSGSADSGSFGGGDSGSFSTDSGSFGGGDSRSF